MNRYQYDYSCEDEYFEKEMTLLESKKLPLPLPADFKHKDPPYDEIMPLHWNDVRFNFKPENMDRRMFRYDNYMNLYDFQHDFAHTTGFVDEDHDGEVPDPMSAMHWKKKRSAPMAVLGMLVAAGVFLFYPTVGLKMPQKDNPFYWRKKYGTPGTVH